MRTILVGYDETAPSERALERAAALAKVFDSKLLVTSVAPIMYGAGRSAGPTDPTDPPERHVEELAHARAHLEAQGVEAEYLPAVGDPAHTIATIADERDVDLVVVGTREPGVIDRILRHSVAQSVARRTHHDVMIVHPG
jgi:nucleotide-binding universal stress UspA family protein